MKTKNINNLYLIDLFEVEELEERMEFGRWSIWTDGSEPSRIEEVGEATITATI